MDPEAIPHSETNSPETTSRLDVRLKYHLPAIGLAVALCLFVVAGMYYPGGTTDSASTVGYSLVHNFVSTLFAPRALNGAPNPARFVAMPAMLFLCVSLGIVSGESLSRRGPEPTERASKSPGSDRWCIRFSSSRGCMI